MAMTQEGELALPPASKRSGAAKRKRAIARHAATLNAALFVQRVMRDAAEGDHTATGHAIRVLGLMHETLQPTKHEAAKGGQGPILTKFNRPAQLVINLKTAKALGLMIPPSLLLRADQVIE